MTILPKKKAAEQQSDSDSDSTNDHTSSPHGAAGHAPHGSPHPIDDSTYHHSPKGYYHRRYDLSSSSGESSPELPSLNKRSTFRSSPSATAASAPDFHSGYNSSEEYDGSRWPYLDLEREHQFELALKKERGFIIKKMRPDGACLFRAVADQVYGDHEMHTVVRNHCMDYMLKNADYFSQYVTNEDFECYVSRKRSDQCYGNNIEMQAIAEMYNREIEVFQYSTVFLEPINIFFGVYKTDNAPKRLSYHGSIHYNSVVDPYKATVGVGLGLAGHKPGLADKLVVGEALRESENVELERAMLEDKLRSTDWDATYSAIEETVCKESYLEWLRENERKRGGHSGAQSTSAACRSTSSSSHYHPSLPPPITTSTTYSPPPTSQVTPPTSVVTTMRSSLSSAGLRATPPSYSTQGVPTSGETNIGKLVKSRSAVFHSSSPASSLHSSHRGTPSPPASFTYRSSSCGSVSQHSSVRNSPYHSPRDSPRNGSLRGSARNSPRGSPHTSPRISPHGSPSPPPMSRLVPRLTGTKGNVASSSLEASLQSSLQSGRRSLLIKTNESGGRSEVKSTPPASGHSSPEVKSSPLASHSSALTPSLSTHSPGSQSPHHHQNPLDFESGRVLSQVPYEYSSFLDLPPSALGLSEWEDDHLLAAVLAASQQEYIESLRRDPREPSQNSQ